ncbi:unnamed protein product, partial [marine sediment metagenome]
TSCVSGRNEIGVGDYDSARTPAQLIEETFLKRSLLTRGFRNGRKLSGGR